MVGSGVVVVVIIFVVDKLDVCSLSSDVNMWDEFSSVFPNSDIKS